MWTACATIVNEISSPACSWIKFRAFQISPGSALPRPCFTDSDADCIRSLVAPPHGKSLAGALRIGRVATLFRFFSTGMKISAGRPGGLPSLAKCEADFAPTAVNAARLFGSKNSSGTHAAIHEVHHAHTSSNPGGRQRTVGDTF